MKLKLRFMEIRSSILPVVTAGLAIAIFIVDMLTDLEISVAVFYVAVVLISVSFCRKRGVVFVSAGCMALTSLSYFLTSTGSPHSGLVNTVISLSIIGVTTYLILKIESAKIVAHEARAQLVRFARITTLGELTTSIAHEVNQPLAAVVTSGNACLRWLDNQPPNLDRARQAVERIVKDANRASEVIGRVRSLAKKAPPRKEQLNINETILEIVSLTQSEIEENGISLHTELATHLPRIVGDRIQLQQVFLNLIINAIEAITAGSEGPRELLVSTATSELDGVVVAVCDTGVGLDQIKPDYMFEAFHTTKRDGMGMGLTISRSIIEAHGGRVWATKNAPRGAIFQFTLPISTEAVS